MIDGRTARASRPEGWRLCFERDERGEFSRVCIEQRASRPGWTPTPGQGRAQMQIGQLDGLTDLIDALPIERITRVTLGRIDTPVVERSVLLETLVRPGLEVVGGAASPG